MHSASLPNPCLIACKNGGKGCKDIHCQLDYSKLGENPIRKNEQVENIPSQADSFAKDHKMQNESGLWCKDAQAGCRNGFC